MYFKRQKRLIQGRVGLKMKAKATARLRVSSEKHLTTLLNALAPEANRPVTTRAKAVLEKEGNFLVLNVEAKDTVALRAALNAGSNPFDSTVTGTTIFSVSVCLERSLQQCQYCKRHLYAYSINNECLRGFQSHYRLSG